MNIEKVNLHDVSARVGAPLDVFICSSSFEDRCFSIARSLNPSGPKKVVILKAVDLEDYVGEAAQRLLSQFSNSQIVEVNTQDPLFSIDNLMRTLFAIIRREDQLRIFIDITTFTHEVLLMLLRLLRFHADICRRHKFVFGYTSAAEYSVGNALDEKWLSKGVKAVRTVLGYPGDVLPTRKTHLIVLVGYELERASKFIEMVEPNSVSLGYGRSGTAVTEKDRDANEHFSHLLERVASSFTSVTSFEIMCNNPLETKAAILNVARKAKASHENVILAPMNNKMSTIGAALAAFECEAIQMCYAPVLKYNVSGYSRAGATCYLIDAPELFS